ncbi:hypothetical protein [Parapedobacter defluvii]|uniref:hypothetical protein n=1 Tax=Parapedobacter defluvii TaxID=2045106 RepID=UPI003342ABCC
MKAIIKVLLLVGLMTLSAVSRSQEQLLGMHMERDKYETTKLADSHPELVKTLLTKLVTRRTYLTELTSGRANPPVD